MLCGVAGNRFVSAGGGTLMSSRRVQYGLVAKFSARWHTLAPDGTGVSKGNQIRCSPLSPEEVKNSFEYAGHADTTIDFMAFYGSPEEKLLIEEALRAIGLDKVLPPSTTKPILRVGTGTHVDLVVLVERLPEGKFSFTGFRIPQ